MRKAAMTLIMPANAAVQRPRDALSSATHVHNEMAHVRRAHADLSRSAATACYAALAHLVGCQGRYGATERCPTLAVPQPAFESSAEARSVASGLRSRPSAHLG